MLEDVRKYAEAALGMLSPARARELAGSILQNQPVEQVNRFAQELVGWSQRMRERISEMVATEVRKQLRNLGLATSDDVDTVRARVRQLEKLPVRGEDEGSGARSAAKTSSRSSGEPKKRATARKSSAKKSSAKKSSAKKSTAKKSTAKKSTSRKSSSTSGSKSSAATKSSARSSGTRTSGTRKSTAKSASGSARSGGSSGSSSGSSSSGGSASAGAGGSSS